LDKAIKLQRSTDGSVDRTCRLSGFLLIFRVFLQEEWSKELEELEEARRGWKRE